MDVTHGELERSILFLRTMKHRVSLGLLLAVFAVAADPPIPPVTVCEILSDLAAHDGKDVAVLGRYSFRRDGRWLGEQACESAATAPPVL